MIAMAVTYLFIRLSAFVWVINSRFSSKSRLLPPVCSEKLLSLAEFCYAGVIRGTTNFVVREKSAITVLFVDRKSFAAQESTLHGTLNRSVARRVCLPLFDHVGCRTPRLMTFCSVITLLIILKASSWSLRTHRLHLF